MYLTDWTFIGDGNPDFLREKTHQINFNKRQKASELILMIKLHQATAYNLASVPQIRQLIDEQLFPVGSNPATDDQRLYEISLSREPRERDDVSPPRTRHHEFAGRSLTHFPPARGHRRRSRGYCRSPVSFEVGVWM